MTAILAAATTPLASALPPSFAGGRLQARFWRSPFTVATAAVVATQALLIGMTAAAGQSFPYEVGLSLTCLSSIMLAAGLWPDWNYLAIDETGLDQQAGLRSVRVSWSDVEAVRCGEGWARLRVQGRDRTVFNRYGLSADEFARLIERAWLRGRD